MFAVSKAATRVQILSFGIDTAPQSFRRSFIALSIIRCSKSAKKSTAQVCQVATVVMETAQLVLSQFKNFIVVNGELNKVSLCQKIVSERCELVKLCHIYCSGPIFLRHTVYTCQVLLKFVG